MLKRTSSSSRPRVDMVPPLIPTRRACDNSAYRTAYTIVFDLDDTLAHSRDPDGNVFDERPALRDLLSLVHGQSENIIWTCGMRVYASRFVKSIMHTLNDIPPTFSYVIYRDRRWYADDDPKKPLARLGRDLRHVLIVENNEAAVHADDVGRAVIVPDYFGGLHDDALPFLCELIAMMYDSGGESVEDVLARCPLVRKSVKTGFYRLRTV